MTPTSNPIPEVVRAPIVARLQVTLSALLSLAATTWTAHWNVRGLDYEGAHKRFGKIVEDTHEAADQVAEMMRQLGGEPVATAVGSIPVADGRYGTLVSGALSKLLGGLRAGHRRGVGGSSGTELAYRDRGDDAAASDGGGIGEVGDGSDSRIWAQSPVCRSSQEQSNSH